MSTQEQTPKRGIYKVLILVSLLVLPGFLYFLLEQKASNRYHTLPVYGEKVLTGTSTRRMGDLIPDTQFHHVPFFKFKDHQGEWVDFPKSDTSISVVNVFYTRCDAFSEEMNQEMNRVAEYFAPNRKVQLYTISIDTAYDSPAVLKDYVEQRYSGPYVGTSWRILTASETSNEADLIEFVRKGLLLDAVQDTTREGKFIHSSSLLLLDSRRRIRGIYETTHLKEVDRLIDEIKLLTVEELRLRSTETIKQSQ